MKKLSILLAVVVLAAAIGIGVLVNQKGSIDANLTKANKELEKAQVQVTEIQGKLDETSKQVESLEGELKTAQEALQAKKSELETATGEAGKQAEELKGQVEQAKADFTAKEAELEKAVAEKEQLAKEREDAIAEREAAAAKSADLLKMVDELSTEKAQQATDLEALQAGKVEVEAQVATLQTELDTLQTELDTLKKELADRDAAKADAQASLDALTKDKDNLNEDMKAALNANVELEASLLTEQAKVTELEAKRAELEAAMIVELEKSAQLETAKEELEGQIAGLKGQVDALKAKKSELEIKAIAQMNAKYEALNQLAALQAAPPAEAGDKYGLGMVTSIGRVAEATEEKPGTAQVNTTVCSLVLDAEGKIKAVTWDVQQSMVTFTHEGKPGDLPTQDKLLTKLEKGEAYGMVKASEIGKEWFEQIAAFAEYATGKTVEEVLNIPVYERDESHKQVPDVEELKASVTVTVGDYLAALKKAADNAK